MSDDRPEFADVCRAERIEIDERRRALNLPPLRRGPGSADAGLVGVALSGGGIRSATFALGVLQALARHDLLARFDYLSTVSGGGYIGTSLTWLTSKGVTDRARETRSAAAPAAPAFRVVDQYDRARR
jgi:predicted acylesterase/phospholipase RssA